MSASLARSDSFAPIAEPRLVRGDGGVHGQAREEIRGQGDQSPTPTDGIDEARQKQQRTDDEKHARRQSHAVPSSRFFTRESIAQRPGDCKGATEIRS